MTMLSNATNTLMLLAQVGLGLITPHAVDNQPRHNRRKLISMFEYMSVSGIGILGCFYPWGLVSLIYVETLYVLGMLWTSTRHSSSKFYCILVIEPAKFYYVITTRYFLHSNAVRCIIVFIPRYV